jgi:hypothetical protein
MAARTTTWVLALMIAACGAGCIDDAWAQHAPDAGRGSSRDAGRPGVATPAGRVDAGAPADAGLVFGAFWGDTIDGSFGAGALGRRGRNPPPPRDAGMVGTIGLIGRGGGPGGNSAGRGWGGLGLHRDAGVPAR